MQRDGDAVMLGAQTGRGTHEGMKGQGLPRAQQLQHAPAVRLEVRGHALRRALKARQQRLPARLQRLFAPEPAPQP